MCGIVGFVGEANGVKFLIDGLSSLEYRGYDSAGIAGVVDGEASVTKAVGRIKNLEALIPEDLHLELGIGHTRWATHGRPSDMNAHPHASEDGKFAVVHNGIIENYQELKDKLIRNGYTFYSETDTEVAVKLVDYYLKKYYPN